MSESTPKICCICNKDVSAEKHGKDKRGRFYCIPCFAEARLKQSTAATSAPASASVAKASTFAKSPAQPSASSVATLSPPPAAMPEFCPGCGAKVFANRKRCMKCGGDVLEMQKRAAFKQAAEAESSPEEVIGTWFGRIAKVTLVLVVVGVVLFVLYGMKLMFMPGGLWDNYPTTREAAVREFLGDISDGSDKSLDKAFMLVSFRERTTGNTGEDTTFKNAFTRMHDDFAKKYGADWLSKIKLENLGANENYPDDEVDFRLTLGQDSYIVATQVQIDVTKATANMTLPRNKKPVYAEDTKRHFGIIDVTGYQAHDKRHMVEIVGPGQPERLDDVPMQQPLPE